MTASKGQLLKKKSICEADVDQLHICLWLVFIVSAAGCHKKTTISFSP